MCKYTYVTRDRARAVLPFINFGPADAQNRTRVVYGFLFNFRKNSEQNEPYDCARTLFVRQSLFVWTERQRNKPGNVLLSFFIFYLCVNRNTGGEKCSTKLKK